MICVKHEKGGNPNIEITIKGDVKEIAALVLEIQRQQESKATSNSSAAVGRTYSSEEFYKAHGITRTFA